MTLEAVVGVLYTLCILLTAIFVTAGLLALSED